MVNGAIEIQKADLERLYRIWQANSVKFHNKTVKRTALNELRLINKGIAIAVKTLGLSDNLYELRG